MKGRRDVRNLMPLMREFGDLARKRVGAGVTPLEYQRFLDLKQQMGRKFSTPESTQTQASTAGSRNTPLTRLLVRFPNRAALVAAIVENIRPAGLLVSTPFAAEVGTRFLLKLALDHERESAEFPVVVATSIVDSAHTLSTTSMGMSLKIDRMNAAQSAGVSKLFANELDEALGLTE